MSELPPYLAIFDTLPGSAAVRAQMLHNFRLFASYVFSHHSDVQSVMVCIAQYWNDEADDAIHDMVIASHRRTPMWPHTCINDDPWSLEPDQTFGDLGNCCREFYAQSLPDYFPFPQRGSVIPAFEPYCSEEHHEQGFRPYAVARRITGNEAEIELLAVVERPHLVVDERRPAPALDERATQLLLEACDSDAPEPRHVLADYLMSRGDPQGDYVALALAPRLDADGRARRDQLLAEHAASWLAPLGRVVPHAVFERGLLTAASVFDDLDALLAVEGSAVWSSVERLHFLPGSADHLPRRLPALRELGPLKAAGLAQLATGHWPRLEILQVSIRQWTDHQNLLHAELPRLRELVVDRPVLGTIREAAWWPRLERLTFAGSPGAVDEWLALLIHTAEHVPWIASCELGADGRPAGWEIAASRTALEVRMRGWHPGATRQRLRDLLASAPPLPVTLVESSYWSPTDDDVRALEAPSRTITLSSHLVTGDV